MKQLLLSIPLTFAATLAQSESATDPRFDACHASEYQALLGQKVSAAMEAGLTPGPDVRIFKTGAILTMDQRMDRLNVEFDSIDEIIGVYCG